ncbi:DUF485 domain-containing protein [Pseudonocardia xishanensis]|uniref:DUF485 domain-containing protein n=1 Tax=Pseudonocardia xishanensis TaxID=630995 RepID=A0ABP8S2R7_9PSEU
MSTETPPPEARTTSAEPDWETVQASPEFQALRSRLRRFVFPLTVGFLAWYLLYVLLASYAPSFMAIKLVGNINVGLVFGLLQFVSTFAITTWYVKWADKKFDPHATAIREEIEGGAK